MTTNLDLLRDLQDGAVSSSTPVAELLRKCQVLAARLPLPSLAEWVQHELNGYPLEAELPEYREVTGIAKGHFLGPFGSGLRNATLPAGNLPVEYRQWAQRAKLRQPIAVLQELSVKSKEGLQIPWPGDLLVRVQDQFYENMSLAQAWLALSVSDVVAAVEAVRNRILTFALEAEKHLDNKDGGQDLRSSGSLSQVFHTHIYGAVGNLAQGNTHVVQTAGISAGDLGALLAAVSSLGAPKEDVEQLRTAIEADGTSPRRTLGTKVAAWLGGAISKAASGVWHVATSTASTVLPKLLEQYYGIK
jgi:hypothetical protein